MTMTMSTIMMMMIFGANNNKSGMLSGSARVYEHQIPGGQYSNLLVQCKSMGIWNQWEEVLDAYRDVNRLFGKYCLLLFFTYDEDKYI